MSLSALALFALVYVAAVATPGPGVAALVARVLGCGLAGVAPFIAGFVVGDMIWLVVAGTGLAVLAHEFAGVFTAVKYAGAAYLLYVGWKMATAPVAAPDGGPLQAPTLGWRAFFGSLSLTLGNPKVMVFFLSIMPLVVDVKSLDIATLAGLAALCGVLISLTFGLYALAANRARALLRSTRAVKAVQRAAGGLMAGVAVAIATR
jgi:threonine/homoserine/homoserine lactone efflux protein